jgi:hypothetical protein
MRVVRAGGIALAVVLAACSGSPSSTAAPGSPAVGLASPAAASPSVSPDPSLTPAPTVVPSVRPSTAASTVRPSAKPHPSASVDPAALIASAASSFTATLTLLDLADRDVAVSVAFIDPAGGQTSPLGTYTLGTTEQQSSAVPPGMYRLAFTGSGAGASPCTITIAKGQTFSFVVLNDAVAVSRSGFTPKKAGDLFVATSSLCRG